MSDVVKVAIADSFLTSYAKLPSQAQKHTSDFLIKFRNNPTSAAIHYEKIASKLDKNVWSVRVMIRIVPLCCVRTRRAFICWYGWIIMMKHTNGPKTNAVRLTPLLEQSSFTACKRFRSKLQFQAFLKMYLMRPY